MINHPGYYPFYVDNDKKTVVSPNYDFAIATTSSTTNYNKRSFNVTTSNIEGCVKTETENCPRWKRRRKTTFDVDRTNSAILRTVEEKSNDVEMEKEVDEMPSLSKTLIWKDQVLNLCSANQCFICKCQPRSDIKPQCVPKLQQSTLSSYFSIRTSPKPVEQPQAVVRTLDRCTFCDHYSCSTECSSTCSKCQEIFCNFCCRKKYYKEDVHVICLECDGEITLDDKMCLG